MLDALFHSSPNPAARVARVVSRSIAALLLIACAPASADLYTYTDESGVLHISDSPVDARYRLTLIEPKPAVVSAAASATSVAPVMTVPAAAGAANVASHAGNPYPAHLQPLIERAAARHGVAPALVRAVIQAESNYNPRAVSPKDAQGLVT